MDIERLITEINCYHIDDNDKKVYFGIIIEPTLDPYEALKKAKVSEAIKGDIAVGFLINGKYYGDGEYAGLWQYGLEDYYHF